MDGTTPRRVAALAVALALVGGATWGSVTPHRAPSTTSAAATPTFPAASEVRAPAARTGATAYGTTGRWAGSVDTRSRAAVEAAYRRDYAPGLRTPTGWTGSDARCSPGTTSYASRVATLRAVNFVRSLSGLYPVTLDATLNARSQRTALMMSANNRLDHHPARSWRCWTSEGAANAGRSNLALSWPTITSAGAIDLYMREPGAGNTAVGHRRWLLHPFTTAIGTGATTKANAITVIGPTNAYRPNPAWVSWPSAGWFPSTLEPAGRWSLSSGVRGTSFAGASVRVWRNGAPVKVSRAPVANGYGMPTVVWQLPASVARSGTFKVLVSGIRQGRSTVSRTWTVSMFTPAS